MAFDSISSACLAEAALEPAPIDPGWIRQGSPVARSCTSSRSVDRTASTMLWDCTAGEFDWFYEVDETLHILEGGVIVASADGVARALGPGDVALFRAGSRARWHVPRYFRKLAFCRVPVPAPFDLVVRALCKGRRMVARLAATGAAQRVAPLLPLALSAI